MSDITTTPPKYWPSSKTRKSAVVFLACIVAIVLVRIAMNP
ncbi:MAG: hypothetical protein JWO87_11 [Phycisphaerales bacterium]|jgi:hypothetical protein|nr:hypothetical protein [Phycisphaerales bacterium]MDB5304465.1 hypothetical protein [Phycisphaerales bacterium]